MRDWRTPFTRTDPTFDGCRADWRPPCWTYALFDGDEFVYMGVANDVRRRLKQHAKSKQWWGRLDSALLEQHCCRHHALEVEAFVITHERPTENKVRPRTSRTSPPSSEMSVVWTRLPLPPSLAGV